MLPRADPLALAPAGQDGRLAGPVQAFDACPNGLGLAPDFPRVVYFPPVIFASGLYDVLHNLAKSMYARRAFRVTENMEL